MSTDKTQPQPDTSPDDEMRDFVRALFNTQTATEETS